MLSETEYWAQGDKRLEGNHRALTGLIKQFSPDRQAEVNEFFSGPMGEQFMTAPASSRRHFHYAFPGGLLAHSINVITNMARIAGALCPGRWTNEKLIFVGLFHDVGKAGTVGSPYYLQVSERWKRERGEFYEVQQDEWMPSAEKGLYVLQQHGIALDHEEYMAIRLNDGSGPVENKPYSMKEPPLALITHWADHWSMIQEKEEDR